MENMEEIKVALERAREAGMEIEVIAWAFDEVARGVDIPTALALALYEWDC